MKRIALLTLSLLLCLSLCSCSITDLFGKAGVTTGVSHTMPITTASTPEDDPVFDLKPMDFTKVKTSDYVSVEYKGLELTSKYEIREITDAILESELRDIMIYYNYYTLQSSGITSSGDTVEISYRGIMDGKEFDGGSSEKATILLDDEKSGFIPGFAAGLIGKPVGETVDLILTFPEDYYEDVAGKPVTFRVTIKGICRTEPTDAIVNALSSGKQKTVAEYKVYLKEYLEAQDRLLQYRDVFNQIFDKLLEKTVVKSYPDEQVRYYYEQSVFYIQQQAKASNQSYDSLLKSMGYTDEMLRKEAEEYTKFDLVLYYVAQAEDVVVTDAVYKEYLEEIVASYNAEGYNYTAEVIENYYNSYYGEGYLREQAQEEKVADAVYSLAHVTYDPNYGKETDSSAIR